MARNVTITTTVTKTIGQIAYEASGEAKRIGLWECIPSEHRDKWEAIAEAVAKALDAERAASVPHVCLTPLTNDPRQPLPVWPGVITPAIPHYGPRPGEFWWEVTCDAPKGPSLASDSTAPVSLIAPQHGVTLDGKR